MIFVVYKEINMKKSKIIIPAIAMIGISAAASITGSVAWFTVNRTATVSGGSYAVVRTGANLQCLVESGIGTTATDNGTSHSIAVDGVLTDGSFNHKDGTIYKPNTAGTAIDSGVSCLSATAGNLTRGTVSSNSKTIYTAITWDISFTVSFGPETANNIALLLDEANSSIALSGEGTASTAKGFRLAFYPNESGTTEGSTGRSVVYADLQEDDKCKYVASTSNFAGTAYVASDYDLIDKDYSGTIPNTKTITSSALAERPDNLGTFTYAASSDVTLKYKVVCWFEGTDENITNNATAFQTVVANLAFEAIDITA